MSVKTFPPPKRYLVEVEEGTAPKLVDVTGEEDQCYVQGLESPWIGATLEEIEKWAAEGEYGAETASLNRQIKAERASV